MIREHVSNVGTTIDNAYRWVRRYSWSAGIVMALAFFAASSVRGATEGTTSDAIPGGGGGDDYTTYFSAGPGLALHSGQFGWALNLGLLRQLGSVENLYFGADTGFYFFNYNEPSVVTGSYSAGATAIPLMPTILYRFDLPQAPNFHPYIGFSAGPTLYIQRTTSVNAGTRSTSSDTSFLFEAVARPGFFIPMFSNAVSLQVEAKLGMLRSAFLFLPQASAVVGF